MQYFCEAQPVPRRVQFPPIEQFVIAKTLARSARMQAKRL